MSRMESIAGSSDISSSSHSDAIVQENTPLDGMPERHQESSSTTF